MRDVYAYSRFRWKAVVGMVVCGKIQFYMWGMEDKSMGFVVQDYVRQSNFRGRKGYRIPLFAQVWCLCILKNRGTVRCFSSSFLPLSSLCTVIFLLTGVHSRISRHEKVLFAFYCAGLRLLALKHHCGSLVFPRFACYCATCYNALFHHSAQIQLGAPAHCFYPAKTTLLRALRKVVFFTNRLHVQKFRNVSEFAPLLSTRTPSQSIAHRRLI